MAQVTAGTQITNVARVNYDARGTSHIATSNTVALTAAERLDLALVLTRAPDIDAGPVAIVPVTLTNTGNGEEAFLVTAVASPSGTPVAALAIDSDGDGRLGAGDTPLVGGRTPPLAPGQRLALVLVADATATSEAVTVTATALTGSGAAGDTFAGRGDGGSSAVVGRTGARATLAVPLSGADAPSVTLEKRQAVRAPDGSARAIRGATITYTLLARFDRTVRGATVEDPIPSGTAFVPGSLRLDGVSLSDAPDADAGQIAADQMRVALGDVAQPVTRTISFEVTIQ